MTFTQPIEFEEDIRHKCRPRSHSDIGFRKRNPANDAEREDKNGVRCRISNSALDISIFVRPNKNAYAKNA